MSISVKSMSDSAMSALVKLVYPSDAKKMLEANRSNFRPLDKNRVKLYASAMKRGLWDVNGESIKFDREGNLVDGQTRLAAIVEAGVPVMMLVVSNVASAKHVDRGKMRSTSAWLRNLGLKYPGKLAAIARYCLVHEAGQWSSPTHRGILDDDIIKYAVDNEEKLIQCIRLCDGVVYRAAIAALASDGLHLSQCNTTRWFFSRLRKGDGLESTDPVFCLRRVIERPSTNMKLSQDLLRAYTTKAWNMTIRGERSTKLIIRSSGPKRDRLDNRVEREADWM